MSRQSEIIEELSELFSPRGVDVEYPLAEANWKDFGRTSCIELLTLGWSGNRDAEWKRAFGLAVKYARVALKCDKQLTLWVLQKEFYSQMYSVVSSSNVSWPSDAVQRIKDIANIFFVGYKDRVSLAVHASGEKNGSEERILMRALDRLFDFNKKYRSMGSLTRDDVFRADEQVFAGGDNVNFWWENALNVDQYSVSGWCRFLSNTPPASSLAWAEQRTLGDAIACHGASPFFEKMGWLSDCVGFDQNYKDWLLKNINFKNSNSLIWFLPYGLVKNEYFEMYKEKFANDLWYKKLFEPDFLIMIATDVDGISDIEKDKVAFRINVDWDSHEIKNALKSTLSHLALEYNKGISDQAASRFESLKLKSNIGVSLEPVIRKTSVL